MQEPLHVVFIMRLLVIVVVLLTIALRMPIFIFPLKTCGYIFLSEVFGILF